MVGVDPGFNGNIIPKPRALHEAWHGLFQTMLPWEVSELLRHNALELKTERHEGYYVQIFGQVSQQQAAQIVENEWVGLYPDEILERVIAWRRKVA